MWLIYFIQITVDSYNILILRLHQIHSTDNRNEFHADSNNRRDKTGIIIFLASEVKRLIEIRIL